MGPAETQKAGVMLLKERSPVNIFDFVKVHYQKVTNTNQKPNNTVTCAMWDTRIILMILASYVSGIP